MGGRQITGDQSAGINAAYDEVGAYVGSAEKVIGYGNIGGDLNSLWPTKPEGIRLVVASYGSNPAYPAKSPTSTPTGRATAAGCRRGGLRRLAAAT